MERAELDSLRSRLQHVERRQQAMWAAWLGCLIVVAVLGIAVPQAASQADIVRARGVEVVDAAGIVRISLSVLPDGTSELTLAEPAGKGRMWLNVRSDGGSGLALSDATGRGRIWIASHSDRSSGLILSDGTGKGRIWMGAFADGTNGLVLLDPMGRVLFQAPLP
ncbi:MAG: hypothetical protein ACT4P5_11840 [Armatimonadota bacterium]